MKRRFILLILLYLYTQHDEEKHNFPKMKIANLQAHYLLKYLCLGYAPESLVSSVLIMITQPLYKLSQNVLTFVPD